MLTGPRLTALITTASALSATAVSALAYGTGVLPAIGIGAATGLASYIGKRSYHFFNQVESFVSKMNTRVLPRVEGPLDAHAGLIRTLDARVQELRHLTQASRHVDTVAQNIATMSREFTTIVERASQFLNGQMDASPELRREFEQFLHNASELMNALRLMMGRGMPMGMPGFPIGMPGMGMPLGGMPPGLFGGPRGGNPLEALFAQLGAMADNDADDENAPPRDPEPHAEAVREEQAERAAPAEEAAQAAPAAAPAVGAAQSAEGSPAERAGLAAVARAGAPAQVFVFRRGSASSNVANAVDNAPLQAETNHEEPSETSSVRRSKRRKQGN